MKASVRVWKYTPGLMIACALALLLGYICVVLGTTSGDGILFYPLAIVCTAVSFLFFVWSFPISLKKLKKHFSGLTGAELPKDAIERKILQPLIDKSLEASAVSLDALYREQEMELRWEIPPDVAVAHLPELKSRIAYRLNAKRSHVRRLAEITKTVAAQKKEFDDSRRLFRLLGFKVRDFKEYLPAEERAARTAIPDDEPS